LEMRDLVILDYFEEVLVDELLHDIDGDLEFGGHDYGVELPVCVIKGEKANPSFWRVISSVKWFVEKPHEDSLFDIGDEVMVTDTNPFWKATVYVMLAGSSKNNGG